MNKVKFIWTLIFLIVILSFPLIYATIGYLFQYASVYPLVSLAFTQTSTGVILFGDGGEINGELKYRIDSENRRILFFLFQSNNHELMKEVIVPDTESLKGYEICYTNFMPTKYCIGKLK